jgi:hypothetical protein
LETEKIMKNITKIKWTLVAGLAFLASTLMASSAEAAPTILNVTTQEFHVSIDANSASPVKLVCFDLVCVELDAPVACSAGCRVEMDIPDDFSIAGKRIDLSIQDADGVQSDAIVFEVPGASQ